MKKTHDAITGKGSALRQYQDVIVGNSSLLYLLYFEFCLFCGAVPGAVGMFLRKLFWPKLFLSCGKKVLFGANVVLRHPGNISLGERVVISDGCILDGRNVECKPAIVINDDVMMSNGVMLSCKNGSIEIGRNTGINAQTIIQSTNGCPVKIGGDVIIGQRVLIVGGGNYNTEELDVPMRLQGIKFDGGVTVADDVWLGGNTTVLGGVSLGRGSIVAASSVVTKPVEPYSKVMGIPAAVTGSRR